MCVYIYIYIYIELYIYFYPNLKKITSIHVCTRFCIRNFNVRVPRYK